MTYVTTCWIAVVPMCIIGTALLYLIKYAGRLLYAKVKTFIKTSCK